MPVGPQLAVWARGLSLLGGYCRGTAQPLGVLVPAQSPLLKGFQGLLAGRPPGTPLTRRDCHKVQVSFHPAALNHRWLPRRLPTWSPAHPRGTLRVRHPPCKINS